MAYITGTATDRSDLLAVLNTQLAAAGWVVDRYVAGDELIAHGSGYGTGDVYIGYKLYTNVSSDINNFDVRMFTGFSSGNSFHNQPGISPPSAQCLWDNNIDYWLYINNKRVILVAKVNTVYEISHLGFLLPYGPSTSYPYAGFVGGNATALDTRYSDVSSANSNFNCSYSGESGSYVRSPSGTWWPLAEQAGLTNEAYMYPARCMIGYSFYSDESTFKHITVDADGNHFMIPLQPMISTIAENNAFGEIDGANWISSFGLSSEDFFVYGGDTYDVFANVFRSTFQDFIAIKREL